MFSRVAIFSIAFYFATANFVDIRVIFSPKDNPIQKISGICTKSDDVVCADSDIKKFGFLITDGRLSLSDSDFLVLSTGKFITENNTVIKNVPITANACNQETCLYRHAALAQENIWQPISRHEQFLITLTPENDMQTIQIPVYAQALAQYYGSVALQCLRIQSDYNFTIFSINGQTIVGNVQHNVSVPIVDENAMYNYYYPYEDFLIQPNSDSSVLTLIVHNPKNNIAPIRVWAQVTIAQNECYLLTTTTSTLTTTATSTLTTRTTATIAPLCGFWAESPFTAGGNIFMNNGDNICGSFERDSTLMINVFYISEWIQPNKLFWGPITSQCPPHLKCQNAERIVFEGLINETYTTASGLSASPLCFGQGFTYTNFFSGDPSGDFTNQNYNSTWDGCNTTQYNSKNLNQTLCFCGYSKLDADTLTVIKSCRNSTEKELPEMYALRCQ